MDWSRSLVREQSTGTVAEYNARVYRLAAIYLSIFVLATATIVLLFGHGEFFVTLSQRSNVETLTIAFVIVLFGYLGLISLAGAWGALKIVYYNFPAWIGRDRARVEARKQASLKPKQGDFSTAYLNVLVRIQGKPDQRVAVPISDVAGSMGTIYIDGPKMIHEEAMQDGSNSVFAYFSERIQKLVRERDPKATVDIVEWATINDEPALEYAGLVAFSQNLEKQLGSGPLWPSVELTESDIQMLSEEASRLCPALRNEAHLPDMEYQVEQHLPIIPEPLAFLSLSRSEQRADPVASMGCAFIVMIVILAFVVFFILVPPWVPPR